MHALLQALKRRSTGHIPVHARTDRSENFPQEIKDDMKVKHRERKLVDISH